jgi:hypothetical protein
VHDCLGMHVNAVTVPVPAPAPPPGANASAGRRGVTVPLCVGVDPVWTRARGEPLPAVVADLEKTAADRRDRHARLVAARRAAVAAGASEEDAAAVAAAAEGGDEDEEAREGFMGRVVELHTRLVSAVAEEVARRGLDDYYEVEERALRDPRSVDLDGDARCVASTPQCCVASTHARARTPQYLAASMRVSPWPLTRPVPAVVWALLRAPARCLLLPGVWAASVCACPTSRPPRDHAVR